MLLRVAPALLLAAVVLSGCAQEGGGGADAQDEEFGLELESTDTTGIIRGVVVDERIIPLPNVTIQLTGEPAMNTTSNQDGAFGFEGLQPGTYFMQVSKLGYFAVQSSADVVAGDPEPPIVRVILKADAQSRPFWQAQV